MYSIDFICKDDECNHTIENQVYSNRDACPQERSCPKCGGTMIKTWLIAPAMAIGETNDVESAKPSSYWRNAEKVKQDAIRKRQAEQREKIVYKDKTTMQKLDNRKKNTNAEQD